MPITCRHPWAPFGPKAYGYLWPMLEAREMFARNGYPACKAYSGHSQPAEEERKTMAKDDDSLFDEDKYNEQVNGDPDGCMDDEELGIGTDDEHDHLPED